MQTIAAPLHFSFAECLYFLNRNPRECLHHIRDSVFSKALRTPLGDIVFHLAYREDTNEFTITSPEGTALLVWDYVQEMLDLARDLRPFYEMALNDPLLSHPVNRHSGLRMIRIPDLFEALSWAIIGQQINLAFAYTLKGRMVEKWGQSLSGPDREYWLFPTPEKIAMCSVNDFMPLQFSRRKAEYLIHIAQLIHNGALNRENLTALSYPEAKSRLVSIRGIGPWTADYVLMKCLGHTEAFPIQDAGLIQAIRRYLHTDTKPTEATIRKLAAPWKSWEAYATFFLWRSLLS